MPRIMHWILPALAMAGMLVFPDATGAADAIPDKNVEAPATQPAPKVVEPSAADKAMEQLRRHRQAAPVIDRTATSGAVGGNAPARPEVMSVAVERAVVGVAPGNRPPELRREGEFVISRKGRIIALPGNNKWLFQFEADAELSPEAPMFLLPCRLLQNMEQIVQRRGNQAVFIVTGQVFVYQGTNHLLLTMFTLAIDKGNLRK